MAESSTHPRGQALKIVIKALRGGRKTVAEIARETRLWKQTVDYDVKKLKKEGLVEANKGPDGKMRYRLISEEFRFGKDELEDLFTRAGSSNPLVRSVAIQEIQDFAGKKGVPLSLRKLLLHRLFELLKKRPKYSFQYEVLISVTDAVGRTDNTDERAEIARELVTHRDYLWNIFHSSRNSETISAAFRAYLLLPGNVLQRDLESLVRTAEGQTYSVIMPYLQSLTGELFRQFQREMRGILLKLVEDPDKTVARRAADLLASLRTQ